MQDGAEGSCGFPPLAWADVLRFRAFAPLPHFELDGLVVREGLVRSIDVGTMHEEIVAAAFRGYEAEAFLCVEELHRTVRHLSLLRGMPSALPHCIFLDFCFSLTSFFWRREVHDSRGESTRTL